MSTADHVRIGRAFTGLFAALSAWQPSDNLVLDISIHSPSDSDHWFKYLNFVPDMAPENCNWKKRLPKPIQVNFDDEKHGWIAGHRVSPPHPVLIEDMFGAIVWNGIPRAYQLKSQEAESMTKIDSRPSETEYPQQWQWLEEIMELEEAEYKGNLWLEAIHRTWFTRILPKKFKNLRKLVIFENFSQKYPELLAPQLGVQPIQMPTPKVGKAIAHVSLQLEHLSASFIVDASHFFSSCEPSWKWSNLTSLALTSRLLAPDATTTQIGAMLRTAAKVAMRMPNLRVMEIWDGREGLAALFQYKSMGHGQRPVITWRATWDYALESSVIQAWKAVGMEHQGEHHWNDCIVVKELLNVDDVRCHGDGIHHLKLSSSVIRPVSLHQIRTESRILEGVYDW
ncbi:hypothetical protein CGCSCA1_v013531 [Colletotrichum siamense]|nr:hypothetical protein CGCSCA1_v013531 [Colletotrichum siamense]